MFCQKSGHHSGKIVLTISPNYRETQKFNDQITIANALLHIRLCQVTGYLGNGVFTLCAEYQPENNIPQSRTIRSALRYFFQDLRFHSNKEVYETVMNGKIGVSVLGLDSQSHTELLSNALKAMKEMHAGENKHINFYHSSIHEAIERKKQLEKVVESAIKKQNLEVFYQPIVNCHTGEIVKFESLCRFPAMKDATTNVQELILIAEDLDLIIDLDQCISSKAIKSLPTIQKKFGKHVGITINCSLNTRNSTIEVLNNLAFLIKKNTKTPDLITVELTESAYFDSESNESKSLKALDDLGVNIAIDDFGTGYSSFTYLSNGQFNTLKIDKEFITNIDRNHNNVNIVKMITTLSHTLGVKVIAEGVETKNELECLQNLGVDYIQGYIFSKPQPLNKLDSPESYVNTIKKLNLFKPQYKSIHRIAELAQNNIKVFDPSEDLFSVYNYAKEHKASFIPVIVNNKCVGVLTKEAINLHLSPTMGTDVETNK